MRVANGLGTYVLLGGTFYSEGCFTRRDTDEARTPLVIPSI